jgi:hypothetical protein
MRLLAPPHRTVRDLASIAAGLALAEAAQLQLQFQLQFTNVWHRLPRCTPAGDLHGWTPVDMLGSRAADS